MTELECRKILGLAEHFTLKDLKLQYRKNVLKYHPDRNQGNNKKFLLVQKAYDILLNAKQNPAYQSRPKNNSNRNDIYRRRREAEEAYKRRVEYYRRRTYSKDKQEFNLKSGTNNLKYLFLAILLIIGFSFSLLIAFAFGPMGVLFLLITIITLMIKFDPYKLKF